jgi:RimJ/RimL family protein N-acetyltransferase
LQRRLGDAEQHRLRRRFLKAQLLHAPVLVFEIERFHRFAFQEFGVPGFHHFDLLQHLANDRRIAENTARIPHPYRLADAEDFIATANLGGEAVFVVTLRGGAVIGACGFTQVDRHPPEIGYWLGAKYWGKGYATEAVRAVIDHVFTDLDCEAIQSAARVTNPASRRILEKCGFQWTGAGLLRIRAISSSAPIDRFRLDRGLWASLKSWGAGRRVV